MLPQARQEKLLVQSLDSEVTVYDLERHRAHCLNPTAALVWRHCDGKSSVADLSSLVSRELNLPADEDLVWLALRQLASAHLLRDPLPKREGTLTRREVIRRLGLAGGMSVLLPVVSTLRVPPAAHAQSGGGGTPGGGNPQIYFTKTMGGWGTYAPSGGGESGTHIWDEPADGASGPTFWQIAYSDGLWIRSTSGDPPYMHFYTGSGGTDSHEATGAQFVANFMPSAGNQYGLDGRLEESVVNPGAWSQGGWSKTAGKGDYTFAGQVLALRLNIDYSAVRGGDLAGHSLTAPFAIGTTTVTNVAGLLDLGQKVLVGDVSVPSASRDQILNAIDSINNGTGFVP